MHNQKSLADRFNRKKTIQNDINRLQNINQKIKHKVHIATYQPFPNTQLLDFKPPDNTIYLFDKKLSTTNINFDVSRENQYDKIPKIAFKEVPIPFYSVTDKFDLNTINQNISTPIHMDIFTSDIINEGDVNRVKKKNIHKIFHVYQEKYADNSHPTGFGDFIRSCFFIIQFCTKYGFQYEIIINHSIAQFLNKFSLYNSLSSSILNNKVFMFSQTNWVESVFDNQNYIERFLLFKQKFNLFIDYLCSLPVINNSVFSYNILFPYDEISLEECNKIHSLFEPSREIVEKVDEHLSDLKLVKNQFICLHIRSGDSYLKNENKVFNAVYFETIKNEIIDTQWQITTFVNNIGNTQITGNKFTPDYTSPSLYGDSTHWNASPEIPIPVASNYRYAELNNQIVMVRNHHNELTYINFTKDVAKDIRLSKVTSSGGNIIDEIQYKEMEPSTSNNGFGALNEFYSSNNSLNYPFVEMKRLPTNYLVSKITNTVDGVTKSQDFRYNGLIVNLHGLGIVGFTKTARSAWYQNQASKRIWNVSEYRFDWRGGLQRSYSQLVDNGSTFSL